MKIYLNHFENPIWLNIFGNLKPLNPPDFTKWKFVEIEDLGRVEFSSKYVGVIQLDGIWNICNIEGVFYGLTPTKAIDKNQTKFRYSLTYNTWLNSFKKIEYVSGNLSKTNNTEIIKQNINYVQPQTQIVNYQDFYKITAEGQINSDDIEIRNSQTNTTNLIELFVDKIDNDDFFAPVSLDYWDKSNLINAFVEYKKIKGWKKDLLKEINDYFKNKKLKISKVNNLQNLGLSELLTEYNKKSFFSVYTDNSFLGDTEVTDYFLNDIIEDITDIELGTNINTSLYTYSDFIKKNKLEGSKSIGHLLNLPNEQKNGFYILKENQKYHLHGLKNGEVIKDIFNINTKKILDKTIINKKVDDFIKNWIKHNQDRDRINTWQEGDKGTWGPWQPGAALNWPKENDVYEEPKVINQIDIEPGLDYFSTVDLVFKNRKIRLASAFDQCFLEWGSARWYSDFKDKGNVYVRIGKRQIYTTFTDAWMGLRNRRKEIYTYSFLWYSPYFGNYAASAWRVIWDLFKVDLTEKEPQNLDEIFNKEGKENILKIVGNNLNDNEIYDNNLIKVPTFINNSVTHFKLKGTSFDLVIRVVNNKKIFELLIRNNKVLTKNIFKNFVVDKENKKLNLIQKINQQNKLFVYGEIIPITTKIFNDEAPTTKLEGLKITYINSDSNKPFDNYLVEFQTPIEKIYTTVKKLKPQMLINQANTFELLDYQLREKQFKENKELDWLRFKENKRQGTERLKIEGANYSYGLENNNYALSSTIANTGMQMGQGLFVGALSGNPLAMASSVISGGMGAWGAYHQKWQLEHQNRMEGKQLNENYQKEAISIYLEQKQYNLKHKNEELALKAQLERTYKTFNNPDFTDIENLDEYLNFMNLKKIHLQVSYPSEDFCEQYLAPMLGRYGVDIFLENYVLFPNNHGVYAFSLITNFKVKVGEIIDTLEIEELKDLLIAGVRITEWDWENENEIKTDYWSLPPIILEAKEAAKKIEEEAKERIKIKTEQIDQLANNSRIELTDRIKRQEDELNKLKLALDQELLAKRAEEKAKLEAEIQAAKDKHIVNLEEAKKQYLEEHKEKLKKAEEEAAAKIKDAEDKLAAAKTTEETWNKRIGQYNVLGKFMEDVKTELGVKTATTQAIPKIKEIKNLVDGLKKEISRLSGVSEDELKDIQRLTTELNKLKEGGGGDEIKKELFKIWSDDVVNEVAWGQFVGFLKLIKESIQDMKVYHDRPIIANPNSRNKREFYVIVSEGSNIALIDGWKAYTTSGSHLMYIYGDLVGRYHSKKGYPVNNNNIYETGVELGDRRNNTVQIRQLNDDNTLKYLNHKFSSTAWLYLDIANRILTSGY